MTPLAVFFALAAIDAPVTEVTVFTDQARVVRTARLQVSGAQTVELPALRDGIDLSSLRVEAQGAEVRRVDIERIAPEKLRTEEAKALLAEIDKVDVALERAHLEETALQAQRDALQRLTPALPVSGAMQAPPKLNASGWLQGANFSSDQLTRVQARLRELAVQVKQQQEARERLLEKAQKLGNPQTTSGWQVTAQLAGNGPATVTMTYLVSNSRWTPTWDLQLQPDTNTVNLSLAGLVSQESGEDWTNASLLLSTAIPSRAVKVPRMATWKIGVADRFIPTPSPRFSPVSPPPPLRSTSSVATEEELVRMRLSRLGVTASASPPTKSLVDFSGEEISGDLLRADDAELDERPEPKPAPSRSLQYKKRARPMEDAPSAPPPPMAQAGAPGRAYDRPVSVASRVSEAESDDQEESRHTPVSTFSLAPPPAWRPPRFGPDSPVTLADGYDLAFASLQKESVPSARGARRVALWSAQWPVSVERRLFPALTADAFLVAELKNPSQQVLPGGPAQLYVGADPAGTARLKLVSPGEGFALPLGIDRALKPVRNVQLVEATQGLFTKEEVGTYTVTIELANPYRAPIAVRVADQWPVTDQKEVEAKLVDSKPTAIQDAKRGGLEWRVTIPPQQKQVFSFTYTLKRPRGWKLQQQEVVR